jgi:hypothetical protein
VDQSKIAPPPLENWRHGRNVKHFKVEGSAAKLHGSQTIARAAAWLNRPSIAGVLGIWRSGVLQETYLNARRFRKLMQSTCIGSEKPGG